MQYDTMDEEPAACFNILNGAHQNFRVPSWSIQHVKMKFHNQQVLAITIYRHKTVSQEKLLISS